MTFTLRALALVALISVWAFPPAALAQQETTTTVEIEISATSITSTTAEVEDSAVTTGETSTDDTLPFTGSSPQDLTTIAFAALAAGVSLVVVARRSTELRQETERSE